MTHACSFTLSKALNFGALFVRRSKFHLNCLPKCSCTPFRMESSSSLRIGNIDSRGALVVLEGLDRCGKTSQCSRLLSYLEGLGHSVELWRFPDRTTSVGQMISAYLSNESHLDDHTIHLLFSANRWEKSMTREPECLMRYQDNKHTPFILGCRSMMEAKLKAGTTLIVDRYSYSGVAFSSAKGIDIEWCKAPEIGLLAPDSVLYLDIPPEKAAERGGYGGERYEHLEFQRKVAQCYQMLRDSSWKIIDACQSIEDVEKQLKEIVLDQVTACKKGKPLSLLWSC
ncbi:thymidylate kinase isoform X1 [Citrus sinensis]|uniref:thymidylate kinase isoform X1 n=2 Tax=Citrus sinensis TaxID=2711 RepID=UPI002279CD17|nr:thymidylate kinase isoform X1 [Citrus sinensis]XP_052291092.1 thymidylate kinase isoform X1 [Citrus sinensis]XP_052291093.1 thymidylate kinase isoform X1 [Citrus sinensis]XP_052291094.1 thymidylate kinase isoform X1 [Citrus sinensis]